MTRLRNWLGERLLRPLLRRLSGEAGERLAERELRRKVAVAAVAVARARLATRKTAAAVPDPISQVNAWQTVMRGRTIKGRGAR